MRVLSAPEPLDRQSCFKKLSFPSGPVSGFYTWFYLFFFWSAEWVEAMPHIFQTDLKLVM